MADYIYYVTVSGSAFLIDGEPQAELGLKAGLTYRFDVSDASCASQTFKFSTTSDGTHGGGSEYTTNVTVTGTAGSSGAVVDLVVPSSTGTLYYYNGAASGYGGTLRYTTDTYVSTTNLGLQVPLPGASDDVWASHLNTSLRTIDSVVEGKAPLDSPTFTGDVTIQSTGAVTLPSGTTAQRPSTPAVGMVRHNTDTDVIESFNGTNWEAVGDQRNPYSVEYLVIAGGGGGGRSSTNSAGGGGAGGYRSSVSGESSGGGSSAESGLTLTPGTSYTVTIGAGGTGPSSNSKGGDGGDSVFASITSVGGGGGGYQTAGPTGNSGGSGGGACYGTDDSSYSGGSGTAGQGFRGGNKQSTNSAQGCGGGGAGAQGGDASSGSNEATAGGAGIASSITGSSVTRAGGGGGASVNLSGASGGSGGGGAGSFTGTGTSGTANTGGGGGGACNTNGSAGSGGAGIVIIRYLGSQRGIGGTITSSGGYIIHTFTSSGVYIA